MKKIAIQYLFIMGFIALHSISLFGQETKKEEKINTINIMTSAQCEMCKDRIEGKMAFEKGVRNVMLNVDTKILTITYNTKKTSPEKLRLAVSKIGYDADNIPADDKAYHRLPACCQKGGHKHK